MAEYLATAPNALDTCVRYETIRLKSQKDAYASVTKTFVGVKEAENALMTRQTCNSDIIEKEKESLESWIRNDKHALHYCILYEFVQRKPIGQAYKSISSLLGKDVIDFSEFKIRFEKFKIGKYSEEEVDEEDFREMSATGALSARMNELQKADQASLSYVHIRDRIVAKRDKGEYDDELLSLTQVILEKNADIYTFWKIRRTTIEMRIDANQKLQKSSQSTEEEKKMSTQKLENLLSGELFLSYECIKSNPKSYSAWYQRSWILERQTAPDLAKELVLCEKALGMDCRNFHCWDHRRIVARMAKRTEEQELEFSDKLINHNFSNHSDWHYRSIALKNIHHDENTGAMKIDHGLLSSELQKVKNAFYMDAEDQSAWTYTRWLLEVGSGKEFLRPDSAAPIELITASFHGNNTTLVFSRAVTIPFLLTFVDIEEEYCWSPVFPTCSDLESSRVWICHAEIPLRVVTSKPWDENIQWIDLIDKVYINKNRIETIYDVHETTPQPGYIGELLEDCQNLIKKEPDNKWPLYMRTLVLLEYQPVKSHEEIIANLKHLADCIDPKRAEMYRAILSRQKLNEMFRRKFGREFEKSNDNFNQFHNLMMIDSRNEGLPNKHNLLEPKTQRKELVDRLKQTGKSKLDFATKLFDRISGDLTTLENENMMKFSMDSMKPYQRTLRQELFILRAFALFKKYHQNIKKEGGGEEDEDDLLKLLEKIDMYERNEEEKEPQMHSDADKF